MTRKELKQEVKQFTDEELLNLLIALEKVRHLAWHKKDTNWYVCTKIHQELTRITAFLDAEYDKRHK